MREWVNDSLGQTTRPRSNIQDYLRQSHSGNITHDSKSQAHAPSVVLCCRSIPDQEGGTSQPYLSGVRKEVEITASFQTSN